jgi:hypothetical protein
MARRLRVGVFRTLLGNREQSKLVHRCSPMQVISRNSTSTSINMGQISMFGTEANTVSNSTAWL